MEEGPFGAVTIRNSITYPYTLQDDIATTKTDCTYKALFLENEYLKITCLPELGGKLFSVVDKTNGQEIFWDDRVIKPALIGMRGAGVIGGMTFNPGPQVHTTTIVSPVSVLVGKNDDGSAYLDIGNREQMFRTRWDVRLTLHPGKSVLDERVRISNPTDQMHPYYFWTNASMPNRPGQRFIYPMSLATFHDGMEFFTWPVYSGNDTRWLKGCQGRDMSWLKNYPTWAPIFAYRCEFDFFGAYDVDADRGLVHVADRHELSGKKAWTWGSWDYGVESQKAFTDDAGTYIEIQSGPLSTQSDYGMLLPRQEISWHEWWYPVRGLGDGFEYATENVAVQTVRDGGELGLRLLATGTFPGAVCRVSKNGSELLKQTVDLSPRKTQKLAVSTDPKAPVEVQIQSSDGDMLAAFTTPLPIPKVSPPDRSQVVDKPDDQMTVEEKYLKGQRPDRATDRKMARRYYEMALAEDARHLDSLRALAVLDLEAGKYKEAAARLDKALARDPADGLCWFFVGVCRLELDEYDDALDCAYSAVRCLGTDSLGYGLAGRVHIRRKEHSKAVAAFQKAAQLDPRDARAKDHLTLAAYAAGQTETALALARQLAAAEPMNLIPKALLALQDADGMARFIKQSRSFVGDFDFEVLETTLVFAEVGLTEEAAKLLDAACVKAVLETKRNPLPIYYLAYFTSLQGNEAAADAYLKLAAGMNRDFVFPSRTAAIAVLKYAVQRAPDDARTHLHLGNLFGDLGRLDEAVPCWTRATELDPSLSIAWRNLGLHAWKIKADLAKAEQFYRKAITARFDDQTLYRDLAQVYLAGGKPAKAIELLKSFPSERRARTDVILLLIQAYLEAGQLDACIELLETTPYFVLWEGQVTPWTLFNKALVKRGRQSFEKAHLKAALSDFEAAAQYWMGKTLQMLDRPDEARTSFRKGAAGAEGSAAQNRYRKMCADAIHSIQ